MESCRSESRPAQRDLDAWEILDDASQVLVRADALVMLLRCADDMEEHHPYGAEIVSDHLRTLKEMLSHAQARLCAAEAAAAGYPARRPSG